MRLVLVSGFLGSGKTTLVTAMARQLIEIYKQKVILIVNDVGNIGIDSQLMKKLSTDVYELFGGCICCQLGNDLLTLLEEITSKYSVELVLMEASGVAEPDKIIETIQEYGSKFLPIKVISLVDATRWFNMRKALTPLLTSQVSTADLVLVNKIDKTDTEVIAKVCQDVRDLGAQGKIITLSAFQEDEVKKITEVINYEW
ncbi:MAG: cobalamin biosynthesis protein P47K [Desulfitobacterium hafniense]|nr:cobalamin biosynthesis protein P47K [Desulfitobacterium hafniense]